MRRGNWRILSGGRLILLLLLAAVGRPVVGQDDRAAQERKERMATHALLFKEHGRGPTIENTPVNASGEIDLTPRGSYDPVAPLGPVSAEAQFRNYANEADVIVEGVAKRQDSALTPARTFVFSEWEIVITRVIKNKSSVPVPPGGMIRVVRPGGRLVVNGRVVVARDPVLSDYTLEHTYLLYLRALPETDCFQSLYSGFDVTGGVPRCLTLLDDPVPQRRQFCASLSAKGFFSAIQKSIAP